MLNICNYYSIRGTLNFVGTPEELTKIIDYLKSKFKIKDPGKQLVDLFTKALSIAILKKLIEYADSMISMLFY